MFWKRKSAKVTQVETVYLPKGSQGSGHWNCPTPVRIGGYFEGRLDCSGLLLIEASGELFADVWVRQAVIHGRVDGDLYCQEQLVLHPTAEVTGNITVPPGGFVMLDGAKIGGGVRSWTKHQAEKSEEVLQQLSRKPRGVPSKTELDDDDGFASDPEQLVEQSLHYLV